MNYNDDDDDIEFEDDDDEEEEEEDEEELLARIEKAFRGERARSRACTDLNELRALRPEYQTVESNGTLNQAGRIRAHDLIEIIDDRVTDLKAKRIAARRG